MAVQNHVGKTLRELTMETHISWYPVRVFQLNDEQDNTGRLLMSAFSVAQVIDKYPAIADATIYYAENYYGETVFRILNPEGVGDLIAEPRAPQDIDSSEVACV